MSDILQRLVFSMTIEITVLIGLFTVMLNLKRLIMLAMLIRQGLTEKKEKGETCQQCQNAWMKNARFCTFCGVEGNYHITCAVCFATMPKNSRYCPHCRNRMWLSGSNLEGQHLYGNPIIGVDTVHVEKVTRVVNV